MGAPFLLVTGFGAFENVADNPSGRLAEVMDLRADAVGLRLPVTYGEVESLLDAALTGAARGTVGILALGVHRGGEFRLEERSGASDVSERPAAAGAPSPAGPRLALWSGFDLEACARACAQAGPHPVRLSQDAGGYVCDFLYGLALAKARALGVNALFLHV
ncbi:MAG: hypothetical protein KDB61_02180, partial [Planctomycetes bacterium]|nr:hypothetical protein [Planctomycetota bacterium]